MVTEINPLKTPLCEYLAPPLQDELLHYGTLPPAVRGGLRDRLQQVLTACIAYIPFRLVSSQLQQPLPGRVSGAFWDGSLLFADLSGFTSLSEELSRLGKQGAEEVSAVVNQLFDALVDEVLNHEGALLKFGGDALTAFFDADWLGADHAVAATQAALAMQQRMEAFAALKTRSGTFRLQLRVGVHSGKVFAAEVGDASHIELVVTGPEVNRVATAQEIAEPGEVVISDQTAALLDGGAILHPRKAGFQHITSLAGLVPPVTTPDLLAFDEDDSVSSLEKLAAQVAALRPYLVRNLPGRFLDTSVFEIGEFRPVTVLFANFHDFSGMLGLFQDNAHCAALVLNAYYRRAQALVHRYDGIVNKVDMYTHGDKLMALFGAPGAHEDDPLRAVRCALEMESMLDEANAEITNLMEYRCDSLDTLAAHHHITPTLKQRIGINTGTVFAGRVGGVRRYEYTVMGSTVNLSARLMSATADGTILLSPSTRAAVEGQIAVEEQPPLRLKGLKEPVVTARALSVLEVARDSGRTAGDGFSRPPLVGRDDELEMLLAESAAALHGQGRVVALVGEAGIGKSRLSEELIQNLIAARSLRGASDSVPYFQVFSSDCQSYQQSMPYAAIRAPLRQVFSLGSGVGHVDVEHTLLRRLKQRIATLAPDFQRFVPLLGDVLGFALPDTSLTEALSTEQRHDRVQEMLVALLVGAAQQEPLLLIIEDIQWADASSLELFEQLIHAIGNAPLLLLLNYRFEPPIAEPWRDLPTTTRLELRELSSQHSENLLSVLLHGSPPPEILSLLERTQGNPFFIEELVRALRVSEVLARDESGDWRLNRPLDEVAVPTSIEGLIVARLDRLDEPCYEVVQVGSVVGRRFERAIVGGVCVHTNVLDESLLRLIQADIITTEDQKLDVAFLFRHALLRDVAYEGILYARRRALHLHVALCIEQTGLGFRDEYLTLLARHHLYAESWMLAFHYHMEAGIRAQKRFANREALALFTTALEAVPHLEDAMSTTDPHEGQGANGFFAVLVPLYPIAVHIAEVYERSGYIQALLGDGEEAENAYREGLQLVQHMRSAWGTYGLSKPRDEELGNLIAEMNVRLHRHLATLYEQQANYDQAFEWLERGMQEMSDEASGELARCHLLGARISYVQGDFERALEWASTGLYIAEFLDNVPDQAQALMRLGILWAEQGDFARSVTALEQACDLFEKLNILGSLNKALNDLGTTYNDVGRWRDAINCFGRSLELSEGLGDVMALGDASNNLALVLLGQGDLQRANELYEYSSEQFRRVGSEQGVALTKLNRGEVLLLQGKPQEAMTLLHESTEILERINARIDLPEVLRLSAEANLQMGDYQQAMDYALRSLAIANELGMSVDAAMAQLMLGQIAMGTQDRETARQYLAQSRATLEELDKRHELGKAIFWQARLAYDEQRLEDGATLLNQARHIFAELEAQNDLEQVEAFAAEMARPG